METKNSCGKCGGNRVIGREKSVFSFQSYFHSTFESMFYMKSSHQYKREYLGFPSPFSRWKAGPHYPRLFPVGPVGVWCNFTSGLLEGPWGWGQTSNSVEMVMLKSNFRSFLNLFFYWQLEWPTVFFCSGAFRGAFVLLTRECSFVKD